MGSVYKWSRLIALIYVIFLFLVVSLPFALTLLNGVDDSTPAVLITSIAFLIPLVFSALSFRFMAKHESEKKKKIGLGILVVMSITLIAFSLYQERQHQKLMLAQQEALKRNNETKHISNTIKNMIEQIENENSLEQLHVPE